MSEEFVLEAEPRTDQGKGASRRLRRAGLVPAVIYGAGKEPASLSLQHNVLLHQLENEAFYSHILTVKVGSNTEQAILKDLQRHPSKPVVMHVDFLRVSANEKIRVQVPLHFINEETSPGVKAGGLVAHSFNEVEVSCLPKDLPEYIEVDMAEVDVDGSVHMSDIKVPAGVELVELSHGEGHDQSVASIHISRGAKESDEDVEEAAPEEGGEES
ncbi:MAG: 50S ribosomal protein L25/general stress protein Ctc [Gammaproteobacteria bacterium]|nr:50S ribosomal protein L25/general stress protein Ctc [Gammaproteobacteria bacterium]